MPALSVRPSVRGPLSQATAMKMPRRNRRLLAKARSRQMPSVTIVKGAPLVYIAKCLLNKFAKLHFQVWRNAK